MTDKDQCEAKSAAKSWGRKMHRENLLASSCRTKGTERVHAKTRAAAVLKEGELT